MHFYQVEKYISLLNNRITYTEQHTRIQSNRVTIHFVGIPRNVSGNTMNTLSINVLLRQQNRGSRNLQACNCKKIIIIFYKKHSYSLLKNSLIRVTAVICDLFRSVCHPFHYFVTANSNNFSPSTLFPGIMINLL